MFQQIGLKLDAIIDNFWSLMVSIDRNYKLVPGALIAVGLVFFIEWLRKPRIEVLINNEPKSFNIFNSDKWHFEIQYKKTIWNKLLYRYPLTNLKIIASFYNSYFNKIIDFQCKPDINPNISEEKDVPNALAPVVLAKEDRENFPFLLRPRSWQLDFKNKKHSWLVFDVWSVFLPHYRGVEIYKWCLDDGPYYLQVFIKSDQIVKKYWFNLLLHNGRLSYRKLSVLEKFKLLFVV